MPAAGLRRCALPEPGDRRTAGSTTRRSSLLVAGPLCHRQRSPVDRISGLSGVEVLPIPGFKAQSLATGGLPKRGADRIPQGLTDSGGVALLGELRPDLPKADAAGQWRIVRDWIAEFFQDQLEAAPELFITRLGPRQRPALVRGGPSARIDLSCVIEKAESRWRGSRLRRSRRRRNPLMVGANAPPEPVALVQARQVRSRCRASRQPIGCFGVLDRAY